MVSLGDKVDVDFADLLDYFALDRGTRAILLYIEAINDARKFISAARAAARIKPVVVIKSGRHQQGAMAARTHTGALAGADAVYDAAFRRAGVLRVFDLDELFDAVETLGRLRPFSGKRLSILTNGGGIGVLAVDRLIDLGGCPCRKPNPAGNWGRIAQCFGLMREACSLVWLALVGLFRSRASLEAEILILRHQLNIQRPQLPKRLNFSTLDRLIFAGLYRLAPSVLGALAILKPETVIRWHRAGFRSYWRSAAILKPIAPFGARRSFP